MILVDSSGWLEFFADGPHAREYAQKLRVPSNVRTPTIVLYEVYKFVLRQRSEEEAAVVAQAILNTKVVPFTEELALAAAHLSLQHRLAMADAIVLATARQFDAPLVTSDEDFDGIEGVTILSRKPTRQG